MVPAAPLTNGLTTALRRLAAAGLLLEEAPGQFAFRHSLTRDAIYATLLRQERQALHRGVGEALERLAPEGEDLAADLALHFHEAGAWQKALDYSRRAAERAQAMYAPREAAAHATRAMAAAQALGREPPPDLFRTRGLAHERLGDFAAALADFERARAAARAAGDTRAEWQSLIDLGFLWAARDYGRTGEYLREALDLARAGADPAALAHSLNRVGNWYGNIEQPDQALRHHQEALALFRAQGDRAGQAETLDLLGLISTLTADMFQEKTYYDQAIALFRELNDKPGLISTLSNSAERGFTFLTAVAPLPAETMERAIELAREAVRLAQEIGFPSGEAYARLSLALDLASAGHFGAGLEEAQRGMALANRTEHHQWRTFGNACLCAIYLDLLAGQKARQHAEEAATLAFQIGSLNFVRFTSASLAEACILEDHVSRAEFVLGAALGQHDLIAGKYPSAAELIARGWLRTLGARLCIFALAQVALARRMASTALEYLDALLASAAGQNGADAPAMPRMALLRAEALLSLGRAQEAVAPLLAAQEDSRWRGARPLLWRLHAALAGAYGALGRAPEAEAEAAASRAVIEGLAGEIPDAGLRDGFRGKALEMLPDAPT